MVFQALRVENISTGVLTCLRNHIQNERFIRLPLLRFGDDTTNALHADEAPGSRLQWSIPGRNCWLPDRTACDPARLQLPGDHWRRPAHARDRRDRMGHLDDSHPVIRPQKAPAQKYSFDSFFLLF